MSSRDEWMADGLCRQVDGEVWYPEKGSSNRDAKQICLACPVKDECLQYALEHDEQFGVWGGLSSAERRNLREPGPQRHGRRLTTDQEREVITLLRSGLSGPAVARRFRVTPFVIYRLRNLLMNGEAA